MKILAIGDIVSAQGCEYLRKTLPILKREYGADIIIANGENSAIGNGVTPYSAKYIFDCGVDVITLGNHSLRRPEIYDYLEDNEFIIRPANFHKNAPGSGMVILDKGFCNVAVINLQGTVYLENNNNPFDCVDEQIKIAKQNNAKIIIVDFHAETTSEKRAMGFYLDSKVSAIYGTHTHVQTSDEQILPKGTGYITDLGMCGVANSVLGVSPDKVIEKLRTNMPVRFTNNDGDCTIEGCLFDIDNKTGKTISIERFRR